MPLRGIWSCGVPVSGLELISLPMTPTATRKKRWLRARPLSPVPHTGDWQENAVQSARDDFFAEAFRLSPHPIGITELETGLCLEINDACLEIFGFKRDEVIGKTTLMLSHRWMEEYHLKGETLGRSHYDLFPDIPARWKDVHRRGLAGEILSEDEDQFVRSDGSVQWIT
jgi:PAS domain-containing protein